uniref:Sugar phosphate transporter domain-containing protein n=1 Tax=Alexandrium monilatum TaxID=311494 RepID=A0A7S4RVJ2_9DINO|mmetsp:Transcript_67742/g.201516  ORF Transcript_67742/g.201516 Transcript_67742/m.201516 type:complete len:307 (-) Transcript_67742:67-987(-)
MAGWQRQFGAVASASSYVATSLAMTSLTKYAASSWRFPGSSLLLLLECWATVAALAATAPRGRPYKPFHREILRRCSPVTVAKALNMYLSFIAMTRTSLPVYNVLKRLQPVYALAQDWAIRGTVASRPERAGVAMICVGTAVTGLGDLEFDPLGYGLALVAAACQSLYLVLARSAQDGMRELSHVDLLFYTAFYNTALFAPLSLAEASEVWRFMGGPGEKLRFCRFLVPYVVLGALLNYATFWCTSANSPLATAVAGTAKGVFSTMYGAIVLGARLTPLGWLGLLGSTAGGFVYSAAQASRKGKTA